MEINSAWDILPNDMVVVVLTYLSGKQIAKLATVSKQFYVCTSENALWKRKFMQDYDQTIVKKMAGRGEEAEKAFLELLQPDHPEHYVLTDWKSGYVMKVINNTSHERLQCFANCLANIAQGYTMLNGHDLTRFLFMPRLLEPILPLKIERTFSGREERNRSKPIEEYKNELGTQLFKKIMAESTPEQLNLKYLLINGAKHPEILSKLLRSNAPSICLFGKWFNQANSRNFPFLLKFDADLELTEWLFTYGYERSAIMVMTIAPGAIENASKQWYLQPYDKTTALLVYLRNHIAHWFSVSPKTFCWIYDPVTLYSICHSFNIKFVDELFYTIKRGTDGQDVRDPVVDSYLVFGNEFYLGELPHDTMLLERDQQLKGCQNITADEDEERSRGLLQYRQDRQSFFHGVENFGAKLKAMSTPEERHAYQMHVHEMLLKHCASAYVKEFYHLVGAFGEFWEREECQELLSNATITKAVLDELQEKLTNK